MHDVGLAAAHDVEVGYINSDNKLDIAVNGAVFYDELIHFIVVIISHMPGGIPTPDGNQIFIYVEWQRIQKVLYGNVN